MYAEEFVNELKRIQIDTMIGVPDSTLKNLCDYLNSGDHGMSHYVPANEGAAVGIAVGSYLAAGKPACVYMQNSGVGNIVNPLTSLVHQDVFDIPILFVIGWRGEPGGKDEPQHKFMGKVTQQILSCLGIEHQVIDSGTGREQLSEIMQKAKKVLNGNGQFALLVKKNTFDCDKKGIYRNSYKLIREDAITAIVEQLAKEDIVVSTTGKISRELYEASERTYQNHEQEFFSVGGMGHASMIAYGISVKKSSHRVYCLDGDGAVLMHMGTLAFIGKQNPQNLVHICFNNEAHESVGGMPTGAAGISYAQIASSCGYPCVYTAYDKTELNECLEKSRGEQKLTFIEVMVALHSRPDLGRPRETAVENKIKFMDYCRKLG